MKQMKKSYYYKFTFYQCRDIIAILKDIKELHTYKSNTQAIKKLGRFW